MTSSYEKLGKARITLETSVLSMFWRRFKKEKSVSFLCASLPLLTHDGIVPPLIPVNGTREINLDCLMEPTQICGCLPVIKNIMKSIN